MLDRVHVLTASEDHTIKMWSLSADTALRTFVGHYTTVTCAAPAPNGSKIVLGSIDGLIYVWKVDNAVVYKNMKDDPCSGKRLTAKNSNGAISSLVFDFSHSENMRWYCGKKVGQSGYAESCGEGDGTFGTNEGCQCLSCALLDVPKGKLPLCSVSCHNHRLLFHDNLSESMKSQWQCNRCTKSGAQVYHCAEARSGLSGEDACDYDLCPACYATYAIPVNRSFTVLEGHTSPVVDLRVTSDSTQIISIGVGGAIIVWDLETGEGLTVIRSDIKVVNSFCLSANEQLIIVGGDECMISILSKADEKVLKKIDIHADSGELYIMVKRFTGYPCPRMANLLLQDMIPLLNWFLLSTSVLFVL